MKIRIEDFSLLRNDSASSDERFPTLRRNMHLHLQGLKDLVLGPHVQEEVVLNLIIRQAVCLTTAL